MGLWISDLTFKISASLERRTGLASQTRPGQIAISATLESKYDHELGLDSRTIADGSPGAPVTFVVLAGERES
jgi:hypothetical protein